MKGIKKFFLGLASTALVLGLVLMVGGWATGAQTQLTVDLFGNPITVGMSGFGYRSSDSASMEYAYEGTTQSVDLDAFQDLYVDLSLGDVIFLTSDSYRLEMEWYGHNYELHYSNEDGKLKVWSTSVPSIGINLNLNYGGTVTIYLPEGAQLRDVDVETDLGTADLRGFQADKLTVEADLGDVSLSDIDAERAELVLDLGSLAATGFNTGKSLTVDADLGDVELSGTYYGKVEINASLGAVRVDTDVPRSEYTYELDASLGSIYVDGDEQDGHVESGRGSNELDIQADLGDIEVNFG